MMDPKHRDLLRRQRLELCLQGLADGLLPQYLLQEGIITSDHLEEINSQVTSQRRTMKLLDILPTRGPKAFEVFLDSLTEFPWVHDSLVKLCKESHVIPEEKTMELPVNVQESCPSDKLLNLLVGKLGSEWEQVLGYLGLDYVELNKCKMHHPHNVHAQAMEGLVTWKRHMGRKATMQCLWKALQAAEVDPSILQNILQ
ncbi:death domain-containing protein CRADD-like [Pseudophryne corroboree]|uniref:death domain-containing protein CRADD-like n=1 Tax=Pseudophryne corroboree TaxID=495146 RepID=UPI003081D7D4